MNLNLRQALIANLHNSGYDKIKNTIENAIIDGDENTLPGLGVMFEVFWNTRNSVEKDEIIKIITSEL